MDRADALYILFWDLAIAVALFVLGYGNDAALFFALALLGAAFADRMENAAYAMGALLMFSIHASEMPGMKNAKSRETVLREMIGYVTAGLKSRPVVPSSARPRLPIPPKPLKR